MACVGVYTAYKRNWIRWNAWNAWRQRIPENDEEYEFEELNYTDEQWENDLEAGPILGIRKSGDDNEPQALFRPYNDDEERHFED